MEIHEESPEEGENEQRTETEERRVAAILRDLSFFVLFISCFFKRVAGQRVRCGNVYSGHSQCSLLLCEAFKVERVIRSPLDGMRAQGERET